MVKLKITKKVFDLIERFLGSKPAEKGAMLGSKAGEDVISYCVPDLKGVNTPTGFDWDVKFVNSVLLNWKKAGIVFRGWIHTHPPSFRRLSMADLNGISIILGDFEKLAFFFAPVVISAVDSQDGRMEIIPFVAFPGKEIRSQCFVCSCELEVIAGAGLEYQGAMKVVSANSDSFKITAGDSRKAKANIGYFGVFKSLWNKNPLNVFPPAPAKDPGSEIMKEAMLFQKAKTLRDKHLARVSAGVDVPLLDRTRLIFIGTGGGSGLARLAARCGFGNFVLVDDDRVAPENIGTTGFLPGSIGRLKTDELAREIIAINPAGSVLSIPTKVENLTDNDFADIFSCQMRRPKAITRNIIISLTDNFFAQARASRLALKFGLPVLEAWMYSDGGLGGEICYSVPDMKGLACLRCMTSSRYEYWLSHKLERNTAGSRASVPMSGEMLNDMSGHVLLGLAYHNAGSYNKRWANMIKERGNRNFIFVRFDSGFEKEYDTDVFSRRLAGLKNPENLLCLDSLHIPQRPDRGQEGRPICPDCGGRTGPLSDVMGFWAKRDTRLILDANVGLAEKGIPAGKKINISA